MPDLRAQLRELLQGRVCLVGVGNPDWGDDGFGVRLAEALLGTERARNTDACKPPAPETASEFGLPLAGSARVGAAVCGSALVLVAGTAPERHLSHLTDGGFDHVIFFDAVDFGASPGAVVLLDSSQMVTRLPQVSTHKLSLGLLAQLIEDKGRTRVWLLGAQPEVMRLGADLSLTMQQTLETLRDLLDAAHAPEEVLA